ncbi:MAG: NAD-glutamate dehydrogenase [Leptospirales bacterium]|nr:NAD-glutamate dehydrogenase [Leptospirales bacterium]
MSRSARPSGAEQQPLFADFSAAFEFYIPSTLRQFLTAEDRDRFIRARFDFFRQRGDRAAVRVFNPDDEQLIYINATLIEVCLSDSRFLLDTLIEYCQSSDLRIDMLISPVLFARRDEKGTLTHCGFSDQGPEHETLIYLQTGRLPENRLAPLQGELKELFAEVENVVADFPQMRQRLLDAVPDPAAAQWFAEHLILLGSAPGRGVDEAPLGILRQPGLRKVALAQVPAEIGGDGLYFLETSILSRVNHRRPLTLAVAANRKRIFLVHFAQSADLAPRHEMPQVDEALSALAYELRAAERSHLRKQLYSLAGGIPAAILFTRLTLLRQWLPLPLENLYNDNLERIWVEDSAHGVLWLGVTLPRRESLHIPGEPLERMQREIGYAIVHRLDQEFFRNRWLLFALRPEKISLSALREQLESRSHELFLSWREELRRIVRNRLIGDQAIGAALQRFFSGLSPELELNASPEEAFQDLNTLDQLHEQSGVEVRVRLQPPERACVKVYCRRLLSLGDSTPALNSLGLDLLDELTIPYQREGDPRFLLRFRIQAPAEAPPGATKRVEDVLSDALNGRSPADQLNSLALCSGLSAREIHLLRALAACFFQIEKSYARITLYSFLSSYHEFSEALVRLFHARLDAHAAKQEESPALLGVQGAIDGARLARDEQIMRQFLELCLAIVRTNYYKNHDEISFKISTRSLNFAPSPQPLFEIFVYSQEFEAVHLRSDPVARGGIRWSDRPDDFRTEILGLVKAQMVKNTLIVPAGSKGGFVLKRAYDDAKLFREAGVAAYQTFMERMLELTDNIAPDGRTLPADGIRRRDGDDPYLVVAADKGTATFSDLANAVAMKRGFWLDDAFASGGQNGYDHKQQGITARGAWESVRRHFLEMNVDPERDAIRVTAIGDMGGDVFGNGMLLSRSMKLVAAFNHAYIFIDPDPDPEVSFLERKRLFESVGNWNQYNANLLSAGGGVYERSARKIPLSAQAQKALGIKASALSGEELIRAALCAPIDLLWNGGIGCYVKSSKEQHYQARDAVNDRVRVDASQLRCRVIGEGGNLGLTQAARVEAAAAGVRLNTDALDNSGGVNMSDHEVNLKILLQRRLARGAIKDVAERNRIIRQLEAQEIELVLASNRANNLALSLDERRSLRDFGWLRILIKSLNREGYLDRAQDTIPFEADLDQIAREGRRLPRPTLCSLFGFAKLQLRRQLLDQGAFQDTNFDYLALDYFPAALARTAAEDIKSHPLRREMVIAQALNYLFDRMGLSYMTRLQSASPASPSAILQSFLRLARFLDLEALWQAFPEEGRKSSLSAYYDYLVELQDVFQGLHLRLIQEDSLLQQLGDAGRKGFQKLLRECEEHASFRPPRELRGALRALGEGAAEALGAFRRLFALSDAFSIYLATTQQRRRWTPADYHRALDAFAIGELRSMSAAAGEDGGWNARFATRLTAELNRLLIDLLDSGVRHGSSDDRASRLRELAAQARELDQAQQLSAVALFEIVQQMRSSIN